jgi:hypothetical protein
MPAFVKQPEKPLIKLIQCLLLLIFVLIAGCARQADDRHFELGEVDTNWSNGQLNVTVHQKLTLSSEAREALVHGVPLTLQLELLIRHAGGGTPVKKNIYSYEIRYLPLIGQYQLTWPGAAEIKTFPRLRHLLAEMSTLRQSFSKDDLTEGSYELMARTHLDQKKMPPPMRLPMLFSAQWRHDSDWTMWLVENENGS